MRLNFSLLGMELNLSLRRQAEDRTEFIYLPPSGALKAMQTYTKLTTDDQILDRIAYWKNHDFWQSDPGYKLVQKHLARLLGPGGGLVDIGCSSGPLPFYLKHFDLWKQTRYLGVDVDSQVLQLDRKEHPEGKFLVCDMTGAALPPILQARFEVVYSKGTICVTYFPFRTLANILSLNSNHVFLLHTPSTRQDTGPEGFISTLCASKKNAFVFTVINEDALTRFIADHGFRIADSYYRPKQIHITNFGSFRLGDFLLIRS